MTTHRARLVIVAWAAVAFAFGQELPTLDGVGSRLDALLQEAVALRDDVRTARFDVDAVGLDLAFEEPEAIAAWVAERVGFEAYAGLLRGPQGTLDAGRGNALDVAVLTARLIGDAGYDTEVVLGTLGDADAIRLFDHAPSPPAAVPADLAVRRDHLAADLRALADATTPEELRAPEAPAFDVAASLAAAARDVIELAALLDAAGVSLGGADLDGVLLDDARAYAWVRVSDGPGGALDLHPLLDPPPTDVAVERTIVGGVPEELTHRIRVEVVVERRRGAAFEEERIAGPYERPVAVLENGIVELVLTPLSIGTENAAEDGEEPPFDVPTVAVLGGTVDGALAFDPRTGATFPLDAGAAPAAGVVRETARGFGAAAGALAADPGIVEVTAVWLDVALVAPGGDETTWRRALLDRVGPANRAEGNRELGAPSFAPLRTVVGLTVATGPVAPLTALQAALDAVVASGEHARYLLRAAEAPDVPAGPEVGAWPADAAWALFALVDAPVGGGTVLGRPAPAVVLRQVGWSVADEDMTARAWVDVLSAPARGVGAGDARVEPTAALAAGVRLSHLEAAPLRAAFGDAPVWTAPVVLRQALDAGASLAVWRPGSTPDLSMVPAASRAAVAADLAAGRVVIVADRVPDHLPYAWWAVDPATGDVLGMLADGRGGAGAEMGIFLGVAAVSFIVGGIYLAYRTHDCRRRMAYARVFYGLPAESVDASVQRCIWGNALYELGTKVSTASGW